MLSTAKTLKFELKRLMSLIEKQPIAVVLLNQVTTEITRFGSKLTSGGGKALKHNAHVRLRYDFVSSDDDATGTYSLGTHSMIQVEKSKISPRFSNLPVFIDNTKGGVVDSLRSMVDFSINQGYISKSAKGGWFWLEGLLERNPQYADALSKLDPYKKYHFADLLNLFREHEFFLPLLELTFCQEISNIFAYQAEVCRPYMDELKMTIGQYISENPVVGVNTELDVTENPEGGVPIVSEEIDPVIETNE